MFPSEIWILILVESNLQTVISASKVSRFLKQVTFRENLWKERCMRDFGIYSKQQLIDFEQKKEASEENCPELEEWTWRDIYKSFYVKLVTSRWVESKDDSKTWFFNSPYIPPSKKIIGLGLNYSKKMEFLSSVSQKEINRSISRKLCKLAKEGFKIVLFINWFDKPRDFMNFDFIENINIPLQALLLRKTALRKPNVSLFHHFIKYCNRGIRPDMEQSFFVGDGTGSPAALPGMDIICTDRAFAHNLNAPFYSPDEFFLNAAPISFVYNCVDPREFLSRYSGRDLHDGRTPLVSPHQELIILVGSPGSGKTTFANKYLAPHNYVIISLQNLKNFKLKYQKTCKEALASGKSVVIDAVNHDTYFRSLFTPFAESKGIPIRCFLFRTDPALAKHLCFYRENKTGKYTNIALIEFYTRKFQEPTIEEGFTEVKEINWVPDFESYYSQKLFLQKTCYCKTYF